MNRTAKRISPYTRLKEEFEEWMRTIIYAHTVSMFYYPKEKIAQGWNLSDLKERTIAAEQLGYDVLLEWDQGKGLRVFYRKKPASVPWSVRP